MSTIYDTVLWLQSQATAKRFPIVQFSGDTDMVTNGWISLTSVERPEVVVTQLVPEEFRSLAKGTGGYSQVERRVNIVLNRSDLRCSWLVRVEKVAPSGEGLTFQEFRKLYRPPKLFFRDIFGDDSVAEEVSCVTRAEFERNGGKFIVLQ